MRSTLNLAALVLGSVAGILVAALISVAVWAALAFLTSTADPGSPALAAGIFGGLIVSGYTAGRLSRPDAAAHGLIAALITAAVVGAVALISGSPATAPTIVAFVLIAAVLGRLAGGIAGRD